MFAQILGKCIFPNYSKILFVFCSIMDKNIAIPRTRLSTLPASLHAHAAAHAVGDTEPMFFLLRMTFWLGIVLILLPGGSAQRAAPTSDVGASDAISAASATVHDLRGFCSRQPEACSVGSQVAVEMGYRAQAGAKMLYDFLTEKLAPRETGSVPKFGLRGSLASTDSDKSRPQRAAENTLSPADLVPAWHGALPGDGIHAA
jgi:hypothetical protein